MVRGGGGVGGVRSEGTRPLEYRKWSSMGSQKRRSASKVMGMEELAMYIDESHDYR